MGKTVAQNNRLKILLTIISPIIPRPRRCHWSVSGRAKTQHNPFKGFSDFRSVIYTSVRTFVPCARALNSGALLRLTTMVCGSSHPALEAREWNTCTRDQALATWEWWSSSCTGKSAHRRLNRRKPRGRLHLTCPIRIRPQPPRTLDPRRCRWRGHRICTLFKKIGMRIGEAQKARQMHKA